MRLFIGLLLALLSVLTVSAQAQTLREKLKERREARQAQLKPSPLTKNALEIAYGAHEKQKMDVYLPAQNIKDAPILVIVHGGGWRHGDKRNAPIIDNKLKHWQKQGYVVISLNYRLLPDHPVSTQRDDVALALKKIQSMGAQWGGNPQKIFLMGHSAGAHLVALLSADTDFAQKIGLKRWLGTVVLDSAVMDVPLYMSKPHVKLYDEAFGSDQAYWANLSPKHQLKSDFVPLLLVCSATRKDNPCEQARLFAQSAEKFGPKPKVIEQNLSHGEINSNTGLDNEMTKEIDLFFDEALK